MNIPHNIQDELQKLKEESAAAKALLYSMGTIMAVSTVAYLGGRAMQLSDIPLGACTVIASTISGLLVGARVYDAAMHHQDQTPGI